MSTLQPHGTDWRKFCPMFARKSTPELPPDNIRYNIGNCQYNLLPGTLRPGIDYKLRSTKSIMRKPQAPPHTRAAHGNAVRYLQWLYPDDKKLANIASRTCEIRWLKDKETGKIRWLQMSWGRVYKYKKRPGSVKSYSVEIPHWDFDASAVQLS